MMKVSISYEPVKYGPRRGVMAIHLDVDRDGEEMSHLEIAEQAINTAIDFPTKVNNVCVHVGFSDNAVLEELSKLFHLLHLANFYIEIVTSGKQFFPALYDADFRVVVLEVDGYWLGFPVNAIMITSLEDPIISNMNRNAIRYIVQTLEMDVSEVAKFLGTSQYDWFLHGAGYKKEY